MKGRVSLASPAADVYASSIVPTSVNSEMASSAAGIMWTKLYSRIKAESWDFMGQPFIGQVPQNLLMNSIFSIECLKQPIEFYSRDLLNSIGFWCDFCKRSLFNFCVAL